MLSRLATGSILKTYRITEAIGIGQTATGGQETAAYLANHVSTHEELLLWQSPSVFKLAVKPRGVRDYFQQNGSHYQIRTDQFPQMIVYASVQDPESEPIKDLGPEQFTVRQDGSDVSEFQVSKVNTAQDPLSLVLVMDVSGSMYGEPIQEARVAAAAFVERFDPADSIQLVKFDHEMEVVQDFTTDKQAMVEAIGSLQARGDTALYDVVAFASRQLEEGLGRKVVIILTDGRDTASTENNLESAIDAANAAGAPIYILGLDSDQFTPETLENISAKTGGGYLFAPTPDNLDAVYEKLRGQVQSQYRLEFQSLHQDDFAPHLLALAVILEADDRIWDQRDYRLD